MINKFSHLWENDFILGIEKTHLVVVAVAQLVTQLLPNSDIRSYSGLTLFKIWS